MSDSSLRCFSQDEFALVLRTATELQERVRIPARTDAFTLAEMEKSAAEAGIPAEYIRRAASMVDSPEPRLGQRVLGAAVNPETEATLPALDDASLQRILDEIQQRLGTIGETKYVLDSLHWNNKEDFGVVHLYITRRREHTRMQLRVEREGSGFVLIVTAPILGLMTGGILGAALGFDQTALYTTMAGTSLIGFAGMRAFWRSRTRRWRDRLHKLMDRCSM